MSMIKIELTEISIDSDLQPRAMITESVVEEYAEATSNGSSFPPITVFSDGDENWLADGYHQFHAARKAGLDKISAEFRTGTKLDALKYALSANTKHGLRRNREDRRRAVLIGVESMDDKKPLPKNPIEMLEDIPEWDRPRILKILAYHEAGHAVAYFEAGWKIKKLTIIPTKEYAACCFSYETKPLPTWITPQVKDRFEKIIISCLMGPLAEQKLTRQMPPEDYFQDGIEKLTDMETVTELVNQLTGIGSDKEKRAYLRWLRLRAKNGLNRNWDAIKAIAKELVKKKTLTGKEAFEIWRNQYRPRWRPKSYHGCDSLASLPVS